MDRVGTLRKVKFWALIKLGKLAVRRSPLDSKIKDWEMLETWKLMSCSNRLLAM